MPLLRQPPETPLNGRNQLAIAIAGTSITRDRGQRHVAILYRGASNAPLMLHLGWHETVYNEAWPAAHYHWAEVDGIDPDVQELFADWIEIVSVASTDGLHPIPYSAFFRPIGNFDASGHYVNTRDGTGLTCATFILALFADYKLPLIDPGTWPLRIEDRRWFRKMWRRLKRYMPKSDLLLQFRRRRLLKRYRPEEVLVAGANFVGKPFTHAEISARVPDYESSLPS